MKTQFCKKTNYKGFLCLLIIVMSMNGLAQKEVHNSKTNTSFDGLIHKDVEEDNTLSPYFFIHSDDPGVDQLPLKSTSAKVDIAGVIADVKVKQLYKNEGNSALEAIYIFPASTRAAVYGMKMTIGERIIEAKIEKCDKARSDYEEAKRNGQSASLLEQQRPNVFQMNVANIMPGDEIEVELKYTELLIPEDGVYEFVYPTVTGPRYSNTPREMITSNEKWFANPYTEERKLPLYSFDLNVMLKAGLPVQDVVCSSHKTNVKFSGKNKVNIDLADTEKYGGNRDFILKYRLQGEKIESGLLLYEGKKENFFLMMVQPPERVKPEHIPPREYVFIVDVSGSMNGFPLDVSKTLLRDLIGNLRPTDKFNIILFAGSSKLFSQYSLNANSTNITKAIDFLNNQRGGGGTELLPALKKALALEGTENFARSFIIVTDGYVTVEKQAFELIRKNLGNANFFTFGIGSSVNRFIIEGMAHIGKGLPFVATGKAEAVTLAKKFRNYVSNPVLTNINIDFKGFDVYDVEPLEVPDVFSERPLLVYGKYNGSVIGSVEVTGNTGNKFFSEKLDINYFSRDRSNSALKYLWARERIRMLDDYTNLAQNSIHVDEISDLGLKYNLLTAYTSFIAIDSEVKNHGGNSTLVKQPLPLPDGVSNHAIGNPVRINAPHGKYLHKRKKGSGAGQVLNQKTTAYYLEEDAESSIFSVAEVMPEFIGGADALLKFIRKNISYPSEALEDGIEGIVYVEFIVRKDGSIKDVSVIRGVSTELDKEAIRIIELTSGKWKPGRQNGQPVKTRMVLPVRFKI